MTLTHSAVMNINRVAAVVQGVMQKDGKIFGLFRAVMVFTLPEHCLQLLVIHARMASLLDTERWTSGL